MVQIPSEVASGKPRAHIPLVALSVLSLPTGQARALTMTLSLWRAFSHSNFLLQRLKTKGKSKYLASPEECTLNHMVSEAWGFVRDLKHTCRQMPLISHGYS